ncbi:cytochrome [Mycobacterium sp. 1165196.3]|uniref:cytochrome P450 n=1 Tax=unclassified Mycobacterium TaxID=2642494 RepID=UPI0007FDC1B5|nr:MULTISPECIES: cytochrome P450 [unclassified Mycobacterium]OBK37715.1 cytochrome [Mycobacterium sp. 1165196.3]OBL02329.1 cytochrome [Mycobacterium sp. 1245499.0]
MNATQHTLDIDLTDGHFYADGRAREAYRWMRENQPVCRDRNGLAAAATYRAVLDAERNPQLFSNAGGIRPAYPPMPYMIDMDDPDHLLRRKLVSAAFTGKRVRNKALPIIRMCDALIDAVCESGHCDFVRDIAAPLPMAVIGDMLGVLPDERATLLKWSEELVGGPRSPDDEASVQAVMEAFAAYTAFAKDAVVKRRMEPTDDLFSVLANAEVDGRRMSDDEIIFESLLILIGGDETTRHTLSGGIEQLLRNRDQWERLRRDRSLLTGAVEEMLRWTSPIKNMCRTLAAATEFHGTRLSVGEKILLLFESANFDETVFENPDEFRIDRQPNNHLAFGFGTHFCLGNQLARSELSLMVARVLDRLPDLRLADGVEVPLRPANFVSGPESMPVIFTPSKPIGPR